MKKFIILLLLSFVFYNGFSQSNEEELAAEYFNNKEYEKAEPLYEKFLKKEVASPYYYQNLLDCYLNQKKYDDAENMIKKQIKRFPKTYLYKVDYAIILDKKGQKQESLKQFNQLINNVELIESEVLMLATAFSKRDLPQYAIQTYLSVRNKSNSDNAFAENLMDLYAFTHQNKPLIEEVLKWIELDDNNLEKSKPYLYRALEQNEDFDYLKQKCLLYIQRYPEKSKFDELLIWTLIQNKDFNSAYRQSIALDKREKSNGRRLLELAQITLLNNDFNNTIKCYQYIITKGESCIYYTDAQFGILDTKYYMITTGFNDSIGFLKTLTTEYEAFINRFGKNDNTAYALKKLANLYMFYNYDLNKAIQILTDFQKIPNLQARFLAETKLQLGDAYLISGDVWESQLLYSQVDKDFKEDPLGQEAKYRNAKLSYYTADFAWSKEQLDVLKTATTQLIANNAIELYLLIQDNSGLDSTEEALKSFSEADLLFFQNKLDESLEKLNIIPFINPKHSLIDDIYLLKAKIMEKKKNYDMAEKLYEAIITKHAGDILADNALFYLAQLYEFKLKNNLKAKETYEKLIFNYTGSLFTVEARKRQKYLKELLGS